MKPSTQSTANGDPFDSVDRQSAKLTRDSTDGLFNLQNAQSFRILVVEDHDDTRAMLQRLLRGIGYRCEAAASAREAIAAADRGEFDVLLIDVYMPTADGWQVIGDLKARSRLPKLVISMSAGTGCSEAEKSHEVGCHAHLLKPFAAGELEDALAGRQIRKRRSVQVRSD